MSYVKKPSVVRIDPTVTHLQPDQFDNDDSIQGYPFGTSAMRVTTSTGFPETSGDVITSRTTDDTGSQIFVGEKAYIRAFGGSVWSSWREFGESGSAEWDDIINKPNQFPPSAHTHQIPEVNGLQDALNEKASSTDLMQLQQEFMSHSADYVKHPGYGVATGSANAYSVTLNPAPTAYVEGMAIAVKINVDNTGPSTIDINGLGAKAIKKPNGNDVSAGNLKAGSIYTLRYNGTNFILQGEGGEGGDLSDTDKSNLINSINTIYDM